MTNEIEMAGPVMLPAVDAVMVKMPAPITTDTPKTVRSHQFKSFRKRVSGSSVSAIDCSTDFVRQAIPMSPPGGPRCIEYCLANGGDFETRHRHRGQHRRLVRGTSPVRCLGPGAHLRTRRTA